MENIVDSFGSLCESYIDLADRFQQLDVEHMTLKSKVIPLLKGLKTYQQAIATLQHEKKVLEEQLASVQEECKTLSAKNDALKSLEPLLSGEMATLLNEAKEQAALVQETISEMESNGDPDLSDDEKTLLHLFYSDPEGFAAIHHSSPSTSTLLNSPSGMEMQMPDPALV